MYISAMQISEASGIRSVCLLASSKMSRDSRRSLLRSSLIRQTPRSPETPGFPRRRLLAPRYPQGRSATNRSLYARCRAAVPTRGTSSRSSAVPVQFFRTPLDPLGCELPGHLVVAVWSPERLVLHRTPIGGVFLGTRSDLVHPAPRPEKVAEPSRSEE